MKQKHAKKDQEEEKKGPRERRNRREPKEEKPPQIDEANELGSMGYPQRREQIYDVKVGSIE